MSNELKSQWLAVGSRYHATFFEWHETEQEAARSLDAGEENGDCYAAAIYHVPTQTLKMRDPLGHYDPAKVRASINTFLTTTHSDPVLKS